MMNVDYEGAMPSAPNKLLNPLTWGQLPTKECTGGNNKAELESPLTCWTEQEGDEEHLPRVNSAKQTSQCSQLEPYKVKGIPTRGEVSRCNVEAHLSSFIQLNTL